MVDSGFMFSKRIPNLDVFGNLIVFVTVTFFHSSSTKPIGSDDLIPPNVFIEV